jgi:putative lipoprotein
MTSNSLHGRVFIAIAALVSITSCKLTYKADVNEPRQNSATDSAIRTFVYECRDDYSFVARMQNSKVWLFLPGKTIALSQVPSASGAKYAGDNVIFWSKGNEAMLETGASKHTGCQNNPAKAIWEHAKLNGVDFRATGNEPGWYLEISNQRDILLVTDYGQTSFSFRSATLKSEPHAESATYHARNNGDSVEIVIIARPCRDTMSGEAFSSTVSVTVNDKRLAGCGRPLH